MEAERELVVVGGGPAGSAVATFLRQRGHDVLLLDEARFPRDKICGEGISPEAWRLLGAMDAAAAVAGLHPQPIEGMTIVAPDGTTARGDYRGAPRPGFAARRRDLDAVLLARARGAGAEVREGVKVQGPLLEDGRVRGVHLADGKSVRARLVVAADGRRSAIAHGLGLLRPHPALRKFAVRGYLDGVEGLEARGEMHVGGGGYCGIAPLAPALANVTFVLDRREMAPAAGDLEGFFRRTLRRWPRVAERTAAARLVEPPRAIGPLALQARRLAVPGAVLVGDAAGFYDPFTGEGVTLALRSAEIAAEVVSPALRSGRLDDLGEFERRRHEATRDKFRLNRLLQQVVARPAVANAVARRLAARPDLADRLVSIAGDFVPARHAFELSTLWSLLAG